jgi:hypothetical protein
MKTLNDLVGSLNAEPIWDYGRRALLLTCADFHTDCKGTERFCRVTLTFRRVGKVAPLMRRVYDAKSWAMIAASQEIR